VKINVARKLLLIILTALIFTNANAAEADVLKVGSKRFTESYILAEVLAQQMKAQSKADVRVLQGLGNTAIVYAALKAGSIDLYPEYAGTIAQEILKSATPLSIDEMNRQLAPLGFGVTIPLGFNNGYALAMRSADAEKLNIKTLSNLAKKSDQRLGLSNEFIGRADGWKGLSARYGFTQSPISLDHGLAFAAIEKNQIDVIDIYTTDAQIDHMKLRVLDDDLGYFPRYDAVVLYRLDVPTRFPDAWAALQKLTNSIDATAMIKMNARAELDSVPFDVIARDRLAISSGVAPQVNSGGRGFIAKLFGDDLARLTGQHLLLVLVSVGIAMLIAIPLAVAIFPHTRLRSVVLGITGLMQTVPSLALLAVLISLIGVIGIVPALIALTLYALLPIMRNTCAGLGEVSDGLRQAGKALGMSARDTLMQVELPLALPTIIAGVRTATAISIGTATIAAFIGAGGYGERIVTGLALNDRQLLLAGAIPAAAMALAGELLFEWFERAIKRRQGGK
jgi:osmoprotectant transport system permease protein